MKFESRRFGAVDVADEKVIEFPRGLPGFPDCSRFIVMDHDRETPLRWLVSSDRADVAFLIVEPEQVLKSYSVDIPESVLAYLGWDAKRDNPDDVLVFVLLSVSEDELTANLRAPVVVNLAKRRAFQMILDDPDTPLRHPIQPEGREIPPPDAEFKAER